MYCDWWLQSRSIQLFERGVKEAIIMSIVRNHLLTEEGDSDSTFQKPTTGRSGKYRDGFLVTSSPIHQSAMGHQISRPDDATWIGRDTVAINHSKSRRFELFLVFVIKLRIVSWCDKDSFGLVFLGKKRFINTEYFIIVFRHTI